MYIYIYIYSIINSPRAPRRAALRGPRGRCAEGRTHLTPASECGSGFLLRRRKMVARELRAVPKGLPSVKLAFRVSTCPPTK